MNNGVILMDNTAQKLHILPDGWIKDVRRIQSPNHNERPPGTGISLVVIHNISLPPSQYDGEGVIQLFTNQLNPDEHPYYREIYQRTVSAHFFIRRSGELIQFVSCLHRAWHAGVSNWAGKENCNDFSIGIELEGSDFDQFETAQYVTLKNLLGALKCTYPISGITGHSDIAPGRKTDPGPFFEWERIKE